MRLNDLYIALADTLDGSQEIEKLGSAALREAAVSDVNSSGCSPLPQPYLDVFIQTDAKPVCKLIAEAEFAWAPPTSSDDLKYIEHSVGKAHVELLGPGGIVKSDEVRIGLYGMLPNHEYGIRTHPAEEIYVMLAGEADWLVGETPYAPLGPGDRSFHASMMPHASRTRENAFMAIYVWRGDISTNDYVYQGLPADV